ncbi:MAG TPA: hypothetical protein PK367_01195 [Candidatus Paceibacterota bacterium]|nr:hypothetical protein [Candidatus Paceibacterota bacterium]
MEKGFRLVQCPGCPVKLRLKITFMQYGKTLEVICPKCGARFRVTIPVPADYKKNEPDHNHDTSSFGVFDPSYLFGDLFRTPRK